jgi:hypothetical protein
MLLYRESSEWWWAIPDSNQDILAKQSEKIQKIIESDLILQKNLDQIRNPKEFFQKLEENRHIFEKADNSSVQKIFLEQSLKGLEYWQYTRDGREFGKLSEEDVGKLDIREKIAHKKWSIENEKRKTIAIKKEADKEWEKAITEEQRLSWNKEKAITIAQEADKEWEKAINGKYFIDQIEKKLPELSDLVKRSKDSLSSSGQSEIESQLQKAKSDPTNPVNDTLIKAWVQPEDLASDKYDDMRRASIMVGIVNDPKEFAKFQQQGWIKNESEFIWSINKIKGLWLVPTKVFPSNYGDHIDSRFPKWESRERAKWEIKKSIESGSIASIYYDGKWEKYTLIDRDGKVSKEVYMNPPRTQVMRNGLSIARETVPVVKTPEQKEQKNIEASIKNETTWLKDNPYIWALWWSEYNELFTQSEKSKDPKDQLSYSYKWLQKKSEAINKLIKQYESSWEIAESNAMKNALIHVQSTIRKIEELAKKYEQSIKKISTGANTPIDNFDTTARSNLEWLIDTRFDRMWPRANDALGQIIESLNRWRDPQNMIDLTKSLESKDRHDLKSALTQLWGTQDVLTSGDRLPSFQNQINEALRYPRSSTKSIEGILRVSTVSK